MPNLSKIEHAANHLAAVLMERYGYYTDDKPVIRIENAEKAIIAWNGPEAWATNDTYWLHEEFQILRMEAGIEPEEYNPDHYKPYFDNVPGFEIEAATSYSISIHKC